MAQKILVVEDEPDLKDLYVDVLMSAGYEVDFAMNGQIALAKMEEGGWDLVLLDIVMPQMDGLSVLETLKKQPPKQPNGPIVLLTALSNDSSIQQGLASGASGYLIKSEVTPDKVVETVKNFLDKNGSG